MATAGKPANRPALPKAKWKILLVGDYPSSRKVRAEILETQGYAVDTVRDADEARARWQHTFTIWCWWTLKGILRPQSSFAKKLAG